VTTPDTPLRQADGPEPNVVDRARALVVRVLDREAIKYGPDHGSYEYLVGMARKVKAAEAVVIDSYLVLDCVISALAPTKDLIPESREEGAVPLSVYESAVKGRQDFRQALREARAVLTPEEWAVVSSLGAEQELSDSAVLRQALRHYQRDFERIKAGETVHWSGDEQRLRDFAGALIPESNAGVREAIVDIISDVVKNCDGTHKPWIVIDQAADQILSLLPASIDVVGKAREDRA